MNERRSSFHRKAPDYQDAIRTPEASPDLARHRAAQRRGQATPDVAADDTFPVVAMADRDDVGRALIVSGIPFGRGATPSRRLCHAFFVNDDGSIVGPSPELLALTR